MTDNPEFITLQGAWGTKKTESGATYYVDSEGKTSAEVKPGEIVWLKEESGGTSAWYGLDNSGNTFEKGSRFWVKWLNKEQNPSEWEEYYAKLDEKHKNQVEKDKLWIFTCGVTKPNHVAYENFGTPVNFCVEIGEDWNKDEIVGLFISEGEDENVDIGFTERSGGPERAGTYAVLKLNHFSPYAIYDYLSDKDREQSNVPDGDDMQENFGKSDNHKNSGNLEKEDSIYNGEEEYNENNDIGGSESNVFIPFPTGDQGLGIAIWILVGTIIICDISISALRKRKAI